MSTRSAALACSLLFGLNTASFAQGPQPPRSPVEQGAAAAQETRGRDLASILPLKVRVVLSKYQGEKKISSLPYELTVRTDGSTSNIRMNAQVSVVQSVFVPPAKPGPPPAPGAEPTPAPAPLRSLQYRDVGTNLDCRATNLDAGRYAVTVAVEDVSISKPEAGTGGNIAGDGEGLPIFRTFKSQNSLVLRDGQSTEFTVATDKMTGEVIKAEVSIAVIK